MNILHVIPFYSPVYTGSAGTAYNIALGNTQRGHNVTVYTSDYRISDDYLLDLFKVYAFKTPLHLYQFHVTPSLLKTARDNVKYFDLIHMHNFRTFQNIVIHHYARKYNIPYVLQAHGSIETYFQRGIYKRIFDGIWGEKIIADASNFIAVSPMEVRQYEVMKARSDKIKIIPNGLYINKFNHLPETGRFRTRFGLKHSDKIILYVGSLVKLKGISMVITAMRDLSKQISHLKFAIVGPDFGDMNRLKSLARKVKVEDKVLFTGPLYGNDLLEAYVDSNVFVLPSYYEIFGIVALEALMCGIPVIVTNNCGCGELLIEAKCGYLIEYGNIDDLKGKIQFIIENPDIGQKMVDNGREYIINNLTWTRIAQNIEEIYHRILSN